MSTKKAKPSTTINPLHFEDLEPKRFEDLIRQLVYRYRNWTRLEATGAGGSDDGFDARGVINTYLESGSITEESDSETETDENTDTIWLIQCKREKRITPKKLEAYLDDIASKSGNIDGLLFVASATFSKKSYDVFRNHCVKHKIQEFELWGSKEIEDRLYQSENDNLLFAYFGISLLLKRQSQVRRLRTNIQTRNKLLGCDIKRAHKRGLQLRSRLTAKLFESCSIDTNGAIGFDETGMLVKVLHVDDNYLFIVTEINFAYAKIGKEKWNYFDDVNLIESENRPHGVIPKEEVEVRAKWAAFDSEFLFLRYVVSAIPLHKILFIDKNISQGMDDEIGRIIVEDGMFEDIAKKNSQFLQEQYGMNSRVHNVTEWKRSKRLSVPKRKHDETTNQNDAGKH